MENNHKSTYAFLDFSQTEEGKAIFEKNQGLWNEGNYLTHIRSLKDPKEIEIAQIIRKYQSSFSWIKPTCHPEDLGEDMLFRERYLWLEIFVPEKYPEELASFALLNQSIGNNFKRHFEKELLDYHIEVRNIFKTLKYMDNNLDKIFEKIKEEIIREEKQKSEIKDREKMKEINNQKQENNNQQQKQKLEPKIENKVEEQKISDNWSQEQQSILEKAIIKYRDIKDAKEKWQKIADELPGKTMNDCVQRFKECRRIAEEKKLLEEQKAQAKEESEEEDSEEEESGDLDEEGSDEFDVDESDSEEEQADNKKKINIQEYEGCLDSMVIAKNLKMENSAVGILISLQAQVSCKSCGCIHAAEAIAEAGTDYLVNKDNCPKCGSKSKLIVRPEFFHKTSNLVCKIGSYTWDIRDVHFCEYNLTCEFCNTSNKSKKVISGQHVYVKSLFQHR